LTVTVAANKEVIPMDYEMDFDDVLDSNISDEALESIGGMEGLPHKTGCSSYCPADSC
jgi:hypothetical protein